MGIFKFVASRYLRSPLMLSPNRFRGPKARNNYGANPLAKRRSLLLDLKMRAQEPNQDPTSKIIPANEASSWMTLALDHWFFRLVPHSGRNQLDMIQARHAFDSYCTWNRANGKCRTPPLTLVNWTASTLRRSHSNQGLAAEHVRLTD